jgi:hypothetical protein
MTDEERRPFPDPSKVRRVPIYDGPVRTIPQQMAQAANADREREGADDGTD